MSKKMGIWSSLNREQKESVILLQAGTFLEYFDLMLYVHMAVLLNELFFDQTNPDIVPLLTSFTLCSTFIFRPIGALIFGWIGDHIGRKSTIILTTAMMAVSCIIMANLPTYAQIGISAAWIVTICRMLQGMSSMGEVIGAQIYLTETIQIPTRYPVTAFLGVFATVGGFVALGISTLVTLFALNWRLAFWVGAMVAIVGAAARTRLRETPEFLKIKRQWLKKSIEEMNLEDDPIGGAKFNATWKEPVNNKTLLSYFLISCGTPLCFYLAYIYFNSILKVNFNYSSAEIIRHNFFLSSVSVLASISVAYLSSRIHPIKILKIRGVLALILMISLPFLIVNLTSSLQLFLVQVLILLVPLDDMPANAVFMHYFPLYRRTTFSGVLFASSRALTFIVTSFVLFYLETYFGSFGLWLVVLPITIAYLYGVRHFEKLERQFGGYPNLVRKASRNKKKLLHAD